MLTRSPQRWRPTGWGELPRRAVDAQRQQDDRLAVGLRVAATVPDLSAVAVPPAAASAEDRLEDRALDLIRRGAAAATQLAGAPATEVAGTLGVAGTMRYVPAEGAFYMVDSEVTALHLDGHPPEQTDALRALAQSGASAVLDRLPVYTLDHDVKQKAARLLLREVHATPEGLHVTLGR